MEITQQLIQLTTTLFSSIKERTKSLESNVLQHGKIIIDQCQGLINQISKRENTISEPIINDCKKIISFYEQLLFDKNGLVNFSFEQYTHQKAPYYRVQSFLSQESQKEASLNPWLQALSWQVFLIESYINALKKLFNEQEKLLDELPEPLASQIKTLSNRYFSEKVLSESFVQNFYYQWIKARQSQKKRVREMEKNMALWGIYNRCWHSYHRLYDRFLQAQIHHHMNPIKHHHKSVFNSRQLMKGIKMILMLFSHLIKQTDGDQKIRNRQLYTLRYFLLLCRHSKPMYPPSQTINHLYQEIQPQLDQLKPIQKDRINDHPSEIMSQIIFEESTKLDLTDQSKQTIKSLDPKAMIKTYQYAQSVLIHVSHCQLAHQQLTQFVKQVCQVFRQKKALDRLYLQTHLQELMSIIHSKNFSTSHFYHTICNALLWVLFFHTLHDLDPVQFPLQTMLNQSSSIHHRKKHKEVSKSKAADLVHRLFDHLDLITAFQQQRTQKRNQWEDKTQTDKKSLFSHHFSKVCRLIAYLSIYEEKTVIPFLIKKWAQHYQ